MSKTHKDKAKNKLKRQQNEYHAELRKFVRKERKKTNSFISAMDLAKFHLKHKDPLRADNLRKFKYEHVEWDFSKNPGWWNHVFNRCPKRRHDRDQLTKVTIGENDDLEFSHDRKPNIYYW